ncbi:MAG: helix-turn-helix domain-containing protein [Ruminococcus bromii]|nr:helix-turn-helix domain-containing protein [Ruminococcus bromii]
MELHELYTPRTAHPFERTASYWEAAPCAALAPYIRCFWGTVHPVLERDRPGGTVVTPDTCADVIFTVDHTTATVSSAFCGVSDTAGAAHSFTAAQHLRSQFGIRFYAWTAIAFVEDTLSGSKNGNFDARRHFSALCKALEPRLLVVQTLPARIRLAEDFLLRHMHPERCSPDVLNAVYEILRQRGGLQTAALSRSLHISARQLERRFSEEAGLSPKQLSTLVRYQFFWDGILNRRFLSLADAAYQLGYADQAHLTHEFKRFHAMTIHDAVQYARKDVAFLQDKTARSL